MILAVSYCKGIFFLIMGGADSMLLCFLFNSHRCSWRYFVLWEPEKLGAMFLSFLSVFIWIGKLSRGFLVNTVDLLSSNSSSWVSPGMTYSGEKK